MQHDFYSTLSRTGYIGATRCSRRALLSGAAALSLLGFFAFHPAAAAAPHGSGGRFTFDGLKERARTLAAAPYAAPVSSLPPALTTLDYDGYRAIKFRSDHALWRGEKSFTVEFFHAGFLYPNPIHVNIVRPDGTVEPVRYDPAMFDLGGLNPRDLGGGKSDLGFAGFRLHYAMHRPMEYDEFAVFLGASYFRLIGSGQQYGISARGIAVGAGLPRGSEEFPAFREFWIEEPAPGAAEIIVSALLDGPSVAGAYRFRLAPGAETGALVEASLHPRKPIERLGLAPLTSMFLYGEYGGERFDDFRPEVHDSDGLLIRTAEDEWIWRPLVNVKDERLTDFPATNLKGFGLLQRDRDFASYLDVEGREERRPSLWVEPVGAAWGDGIVQLFEYESDTDYDDNMVASWIPRRPVGPGTPIELAYRVTAFDRPEWPPIGRAVRTKIGSAERLRPTKPPSPERRFFMIDFEGGELPLRLDGQPVEPEVSSSSGDIVMPVVQRVPQTGGWRLYFEFRPAAGQAAELTARLQLQGRQITETWRFSWQAKPA